MKEIDEKAVSHILEALIKMAADRVYDVFGLDRPAKTRTCNRGEKPHLDDKDNDDN